MSGFVHLLWLLAVAHFTWCSSLPLLAERAILVNDVSELKHAYDYVIIGGGTSGLTFANRLTEDKKSISAGSRLRMSSLIWSLLE